MAARLDDFAHIHELFSAFGPISVRRMFGGAGLYADGVMFAILSDDLIFLKADAATAPAFEAEGCSPFTYETKDGRRSVMSYWRAPERLYDDPEELAQWARRALGTAQRGAAASKRIPRTRRSTKRSGTVRR